MTPLNCILGSSKIILSRFLEVQQTLKALPNPKAQELHVKNE